jgi:two-component system sensor histidine kinase BaeS
MRSLTWKLMLAFLAISLTGAVLASIFARWITVQEFDRLVLEQAQSSFLSEVTAYYQTHRSWIGVTEYFRQRADSRQPPPGEPDKPPAQPQTAGGAAQPPQSASGAGQPLQVPVILIDQNGYVLHPVPPYRLGDYVPPAQLARGKPVKIGDQVVGTILATGAAPPLDAREQQYLDRTNLALLVSALGAVTIALLLSLALARTLTHPVRDLTSAIRAMAQGKLGVSVPVRSRDELGLLTTVFNQMSADLARANQARRQMTADIAHDLRTPLSVIQGYCEGLRDGVLKPTPKTFQTMYQEAEHLSLLVEDLRTLSLADAGELKLSRQRVSPRELLERIAAAHQLRAQERQVALQVNAEPGLPEVNVDPERMAQVLNNLVGNALRYTPAGGQITLAATQNANHVHLTVQDTGVGIAPDDLPRIFDRFYRGDASRGQQAGESGLGLAIARSIVELHSGTITAESELGVGTTLTVALPVMRE